MKKIFSILFALVLVVSLGLAMATPVLAGTIRHVPSVYPTIQAAINASVSGDTIMVAAGEYAAFKVEEKENISIISTAGATVTTAADFEVIENTWVMATVYESENINIEGINFDGTEVWIGEEEVFFGIAYVDSTGRIADLTAENITGGVGVAILGVGVDVDTSVDLSGVTFENSMGGVVILDAEANLDGCTITGMSVGIGIGVMDEWVGPATVHNLKGSTISDNLIGIAVSGGSILEAHFNNIAGNEFYGLYTTNSTFTADATYNWWGHASGPYHGILNPDGTGDDVGDNVDFEPWLDAEVVTETVTDDTVDAKEEADTEVAVNGTATVTVARYDDNPHPGGDAPTDFNAVGKYIDVYIPDTTEVTEIEIRLYYTDAELAAAGVDEESLRLFWWNDTAWVQCSPDSGVNTTSTTGYSGYMWAKIRATGTTPSLADLQGTEFGGYGHPSETPGGGCFIATAAYGTDTAEQLDILREFRDEVLLPNSLGAEFVSLYYKTSPPIANFISQHKVLRTAVRVGFVDPIVAILNWSHALWSARGP